MTALKETREEQAGGLRPDVCCGCGTQATTKEPLHYDHCHETDRFRGWLCRNCNVVLGLVKDRPTVLRTLALYLEEDRLTHASLYVRTGTPLAL